MSTGTAGDDDAASMMSMKGKKAKGKKSKKTKGKKAKKAKGKKAKKAKKSKGKKGPSGDYDDDGPPPAPTAIAGDDDADPDDLEDALDADATALLTRPCNVARPQAPRDLSTDSSGLVVEGSNSITPMKASPPSWALQPSMFHVNTHFHEGSEHKSDSYYIERPGENGFWCPIDVPVDQMEKYVFQYCTGVEVGGTYEFHWVHSSGGTVFGAGLGNAFSLVNNPSVQVWAQTILVVNTPVASDSDFSIDSPSMNDREFIPVSSYIGSTTGGSYNNELCSPYEVSWTVDTDCVTVSAKQLDEVCKDLIERGLEADAHPHKTRKLVAPEWTVPTSEVEMYEIYSYVHQA
ncbi:hypothetical protein TrST_g6185 [Triparma strigata]|uniref:Uncharacterized protein n=1 Tax=Triparma strigata TaxID=1606541 RepID=A0A9W7C5G1_9STRA|nr:hypothetical protein TrST_g6185 [Triparma strigata]